MAESFIPALLNFWALDRFIHAVVERTGAKPERIILTRAEAPRFEANAIGALGTDHGPMTVYNGIPLAVRDKRDKRGFVPIQTWREQRR